MGVKMKRKKYGTDLKTKVALMVLKAQKSSSEISSEFGIHVSQVNRWKNQAAKALPDVFGGRSGRTFKAMEDDRDRLFQQIGRLQVELDRLKKNMKHVKEQVSYKCHNVVNASTGNLRLIYAKSYLDNGVHLNDFMDIQTNKLYILHETCLLGCGSALAQSSLVKSQ